MPSVDDRSGPETRVIKVLVVSSSFPRDSVDWKSRFISDLVIALARRDDIELRLWSPPGELPESVRYEATQSERRWLETLLDRGGIAQLLRDSRWQGVRAGLRLLWLLFWVYRRNRDVHLVHVNWLQNSLPLWSTRLPCLVSVLGSDFQLLGMGLLTRALRSTLRRRRTVISPNASWMVPALREHFRSAAEVREVPFGVSHLFFDVTRVVNQDGRFRWIVVLRVTRKKMGPLFDWGERWLTANDELHLFGPMQEKVSIPSWVHYHGPASPRDLLERWYPRVDGMITLSQHDEGRPQVLLEAMAAGLPVVASDISGHRNLIRDGETGFLVHSDSDFNRAIEQLRDRHTNARIGNRAQQWMRETVGTWDDCADRFVDTYRRLLDSTRP